MKFSRSDIRTWSILGQRGTYGLTLCELAQENSDVIAMTADLCNTSGLDRFQKSFPERIVNVGIAEQNMVGIAAGISQTGKVVFASTFANFASMRACEQMRHFLGYMKSNVKIVGLSAGFGMELFGVTHYGIEDVAMLRAISNLVIVSPADGAEVVKTVYAAAEINSPVYIRLTGVMNQPIVYSSDFDFELGKANILKEGSDVAFFAAGSMVYQSLEAAKLLEVEGLSCAVVDMHTIKPLDKEVLDAMAANKKLVVSVEEHSVIGGLGGAISEHLAGQGNMPLLVRIGVNDYYPKAGDYQYMLKSCGLNSASIVETVINKIKNNGIGDHV